MYINIYIYVYICIYEHSCFEHSCFECMCRCDLMELCQTFLEFITKYTISGSCDFMEYTVMDLFFIFLESKKKIVGMCAGGVLHTYLNVII